MLALGLDDYGSDSDSGKDARQPSPADLKPATSSKSLSNSQKSSSNVGIATKSKRAPKKITIGLPALPASDDEDDDKPPAKKQRLRSGAGSSSLLSMLPPPKHPTPAQKQSAPSSERVLGSGQRPGLVFNAIPTPAAAIPSSSSSEKEVDSHQVEADFFSLGSASSSAIANPAIPSTSTNASVKFSAAPEVEEFITPEPTPTDPYPGYYLLPSGAWAAYDPGYYQSFYKKWEKDYNAHVRALEKGTVKGFEGLETENTQEVDAQKEMEKAKREIQEREERKAVTHGAAGEPAAPKMNVQGAKLGARARSRHQLTTLLSEAYANRETLEEKIAEGRRNRKEAGNKYGF